MAVKAAILEWTKMAYSRMHHFWLSWCSMSRGWLCLVAWPDMCSHHSFSCPDGQKSDLGVCNQESTSPAVVLFSSVLSAIWPGLDVPDVPIKMGTQQANLAHSRTGPNGPSDCDHCQPYLRSS